MQFWTTRIGNEVLIEWAMVINFLTSLCSKIDFEIWGFLVHDLHRVGEIYFKDLIESYAIHGGMI